MRTQSTMSPSGSTATPHSALQGKGKQNATVVALITLGSIALLNVLGLQFFGRVDRTKDRVYTLSEATKTTLAALEDPVTVTCYFTDNLPPPLSSNARYVRDLLEEFRAQSKGKVGFEFIDPASQETEEDKAKKKEVKRTILGTTREQTSVEQKLGESGIQPVQVRVVEQDQAQQKNVYMAIEVAYGENKQVIPVVQSTDGLEYDLTTLIRRLTQQKVPVVGVLQGHGELSPEDPDLQQLTQLLQQNYEVRPVPLTPGADGSVKIPDEIAGIFVIGPKQAYADPELRAIDAFLMKGKGAAFLVDRVSVDLKTFQPTPVSSGLEALLTGYGMELGTTIVGDLESVELTMAERRGMFMIPKQIKYPFIPMPKQLAMDSIVSKGIGDVTLPFVTTVTKKPIDGVELTTLARSGSKSWLEEPTAENVNPQRSWETEPTYGGPYDVAVTAKGLLPSQYTAGTKSKSESRVLVIGTAGLVVKQMMGPQNANLVLNATDWLLFNEQLITMRSRGLVEAPLAADLSDTVRNVVKVTNVVGVPLLLLVYGLLRWQQRNGKRRALRGAT